MDDLDTWVSFADATQSAIKLFIAAARRSTREEDTPSASRRREVGRNKTLARN